jgi:hypothetical protein
MVVCTCRCPARGRTRSRWCDTVKRPSAIAQALPLPVSIGVWELLGIMRGGGCHAPCRRRRARAGHNHLCPNPLVSRSATHRRRRVRGPHRNYHLGLACRMWVHGAGGEEYAANARYQWNRVYMQFSVPNNGAYGRAWPRRREGEREGDQREGGRAFWIMASVTSPYDPSSLFVKKRIGPRCRTPGHSHRLTGCWCTCARRPAHAL